LENHLFRNQKNGKLRQVQLATLPDPFYKFVYQDSPRGLGHAVWTAREYLRDEPFAVILPDDFIHAKKPCLAQMIEHHALTGGNMVATMDVGPQEISAYGCLDYTEIEGNCGADAVAVKPCCCIGLVVENPVGHADEQKPGDHGGCVAEDKLVQVPIHPADAACSKGAGASDTSESAAPRGGGPSLTHNHKI